MRSLLRAFDLFSLSEYESVKNEATDRIVSRYSRGNVSIQNGWYLDGEKLQRLSATADVSMNKMAKYFPSLSQNAAQRKTKGAAD